MKKMRINPMVLAALLLIVGLHTSFSQTDKKSSKKQKGNKKEIKSDTIPDFNKPQPYDKVITADAELFKGVLNVAKVKDRYYFEIPDSMLDRDFQVTSRIGKGPAAMERPQEAFAGRILESEQIRFTKAPNDKLFVKRFVYDEVATDSSDNGLYKALKMNDLQPVMSAFTVKAYGKNSIVIDVTDYINSDLRIFTGNLKESIQGISFQADRSYIKNIEALPMSIEISTVKTFEANQVSMTTEVNTSFLLLPLNVMRIRYADERVGYNSQSKTDLDQDPQRIKRVEIINKWRLEPKPEDLERYKQGELVEPVKPIVFYINPATPKKWVPYIVRAVNDWQPAFEKAGFKNAIYAQETTINDSLWNAKNGGLNTIDYAATLSSEIAQKLVIDPRSGEILQAKIEINHNVLSALYYTYMVQAGAIDTKEQKRPYSTDLMGELLRVELTSHVGISLGLLANAGAASTVPVAKLRDRDWVEKHGISPSIMQNTLFNYVAQPEDNITRKGIMGRIGEYDKWAIFWGYKIHPEMKNLLEERTYLRKMITDSLKANPQLYYGVQPKDGDPVVDPRNQPNNLSDNAIEASRLGIKNLKIIINNLPKWTLDKEKLYTATGGDLGNNMSYLVGQYLTYLINVSDFFGTYYYNPQDAGSTQKVFSAVPLERQKQAMAFLKNELFDKGPQWLIYNETANLSMNKPYNNDMHYLGSTMITRLLDLKKLNNINATAERFGTTNSYTVVSYLNDLQKAVWPELNTSAKVSGYHMVVQKMYLNALTLIIDTPRDVLNTNTVAVTRGSLFDLRQKIASTLKMVADKDSKDHYRDVLSKINELLNPKRVVPPPAFVPGAPNAKKSIQQGLENWKNESFTY